MIPVPRRPLLTMDPSKLTYFARAHMVRAGAMGVHGALQGLGEYGYPELKRDEQPAVSTEPGAYSGPGTQSGWVSDTAVPHGSTRYTNFTAEEKSKSISDWMSQFNTLLVGQAVEEEGAGVLFKARGSPLFLVLGGAAVLVGGILLYKVATKK